MLTRIRVLINLKVNLNKSSRKPLTEVSIYFHICILEMNTDKNDFEVSNNTVQFVVNLLDFLDKEQETKRKETRLDKRPTWKETST